MSSEYLTLDETQNLLITRYLHFITISAWTWDALISLGDEIDIFSGRCIVLVDLVYLSSRHSSQRLRDHGSRLKIFLTILWSCASLSIILTIPSSISGIRAQPIGLCNVARIDKAATVPSITVAIFDLTIYIMISYRMLPSPSCRTKGRWNTVKAFFTGSTLAPVSRALLRTGQIYLFPMAGIFSCMLVIEFSNSLKSSILVQYRAVVLLEGGVFLNAMSCRVFRLLRREGLPDDSGLSLRLSNIQFHQILISNTIMGQAT
ncbi:hypothetical protein QCA50_011596 [Cerrena zonata]|uniref:Uncharacterized protein n=1 Tax=Cerrena zonata TaxID=2478898 RepID=A0AAW0G5G8_9APHY